tara:strand:+ start:12523 stop:13716 length:1194 start_codon:yes stop_codon:yes gene_type:complete
MGFETLSCAIAHVIMDYHAYRTNTPLLDTDTSIKNILHCSTDERDRILKEKIIEATTDNNSCRLTLLQYMHFGISLSEKARIIENPDEQKALHLQLVEFIQNIQRLFVFTPANLFITDRLLVSLGTEQSLAVYKLNSPAAEAYKLTHTFFSTIKLSPSSTESTEAEIQHYINDLFLFKQNQALSQDNSSLEDSIASITQYMNTLESQIDQATTKTTLIFNLLHQKQETHVSTHNTDNTDNNHEAHATRDWEFVTLGSSITSEVELENQRLINHNQELTKIYEEKQQRCIILESTLTTLQNKAKVKSDPEHIALATPELHLGLSRRKTTHNAVVTEQPMRRDSTESTDNHAMTACRTTSMFKSGKFSLFNLLMKSLDASHNFSDSASSDSTNSKSSLT